MSQEGFWERSDKNLMNELKNIKGIYGPYNEINKECIALKELLEIIDAKDEHSLSELQKDLEQIDAKIDALEFRTLLKVEDDRPAILSINAGAGGTEACDWANMLLRMYLRWCEIKKFSYETTDFLSGEEVGIKNVTVIINGSYAYGYLKGENGVHRLVRISPFDSNKRRHTSFASVDVIPEISDDIQINIKPDEIRMETFRAGGKGGQHVNVTDSAVRLIHIPTGLIVQCQNERSQYKNKAMALKVLQSKLYEREKKLQEEKFADHYKQKQKIEWGSQVRSYVMQPYSLVKDHRTDYETSNVESVLNGEIDNFMEAYLKWKAGNK